MLDSNNFFFRASFLIIILFFCGCTHFSRENVKVIAHRGASGYLPEHTLASKALAFGLGADFIEQDVLITKDNQAVVLHDLYLDAVTNVSDIFPGRQRSDGHFYVIDFSLAELRKLNLHERTDPITHKVIFQDRFPLNSTRFQISTLEEEIDLIQGLNKSMGRNVGAYTEIKSPSWHRKHGKDISKIVLGILDEKGYRNKADNIYVECFDPDELKRLRVEFNTKLKLIQLIDDNFKLESDADYEYLQTPNGLKQISSYADGIGPWLPQVLIRRNKDGGFIFSKLVDNAHKHGLEVHVYTLRKDDISSFQVDFKTLLKALIQQAGVDGIFTDFADYVKLEKASW